MKNKTFFIGLAIISLNNFSFSAQAQSLSLSQQAQAELNSSRKTDSHTKQVYSPDYLSAEQTSLILKLEDPLQKIQLREFQWSFGFALQSYQPKGQISINSNTEEDLQKTNSTVMPSLMLGSLYNAVENPTLALQFGPEIEVGYTSQSVQIGQQSGEISANLHSLMSEVRFLNRIGKTFDSKFHGRIGLGLGRLSLTQASSNSLGRWSRNGDYVSFLLGGDYQITRQWAALANYKVIQSRQNWPSELAKPDNQLELGAQVLW